MRIGVNLLPLRPGEVGGAESYMRDLLDAIMRIDGGNEYVLVTAEYNHETLALPYENSRRRMLFERGAPSGLALRLKNRLKRSLPVSGLLKKTARGIKADALRHIIREETLDLWFCPFGNLEPSDPSIPSVITVLDLQHEYCPEFFEKKELLHRREFYPRSCRDATRIISISNFTRQTIINRYGVSPEKIAPIWLAVGSVFNALPGPEQLELIREKYALPKRYFFYPSNTWRHKNHKTLLEAFSLFQKKTVGGKLVLTGAGTGIEKAIDKAVTSLGLQDDVLALGYVLRDDLPSIYAAATALVFPSLFEGFGIPLLEAMAVGCPVIASNTTSVPEILGDAGLLFDPLNAEGIADAMIQIHNNSGLREQMIRRGKERIGLFSCEETARRTLEVFEDAARGFASEKQPV
jgi:glycosyltransferase involved in cell wall biosynthesis